MECAVIHRERYLGVIVIEGYTAPTWPIWKVNALPFKGTVKMMRGSNGCCIATIIT